MKHMPIRKTLLVTAMLGGMMNVAPAQTYTNGQTGLFGNPELWNNKSNVNFDNVNDSLSVRFTTMESVTVDRVWQNLGFVDNTGTAQLRVGVMADIAGNPSGTYLSSGVWNPVDGGQIATFGSLSLSPNTVYHLVYQAISLDSDSFIAISSANVNNDIRPYDRAIDLNMNTLFSNNGGSWSVRDLDPYFIFANGGDTAWIPGPGQPYVNSDNANGTVSIGNGGNKYGQVFTITDKEVPAGSWVAFNTLNLKTLASATALANSQSMIVRIRDLNNNILASVTITAAEADGTQKTYTLDKQIELQQGVQYVFTTEFVSFGTVAESFALYNNNTVIPGITGPEAAAGWGGTNLSYVVKNKANGGNIWIASDFEPVVNGDIERSEILFSFEGIVVPEPSTALLALAGALLLSRRRQ